MLINEMKLIFGLMYRNPGVILGLVAGQRSSSWQNQVHFDCATINGKNNLRSQKKQVYGYSFVRKWAVSSRPSCRNSHRSSADFDCRTCFFFFVHAKTQKPSSCFFMSYVIFFFFDMHTFFDFSLTKFVFKKKSVFRLLLLNKSNLVCGYRQDKSIWSGYGFFFLYMFLTSTITDETWTFFSGHLSLNILFSLFLCLIFLFMFRKLKSLELQQVHFSIDRLFLLQYFTSTQLDPQ